MTRFVRRLSLNNVLRRNIYTVDAKFYSKLIFYKDLPVTNLQFTPSKAESIEYYKQLKTIRSMELECDKMFKSRQIRGYCHLYDGQVKPSQYIGSNSSRNKSSTST